MAVKKRRLSKPSKMSTKLNFHVRHYFKKSGGYFVVTDKKRRIVSLEKYKNHDLALEFAKELHNNPKAKK